MDTLHAMGGTDHSMHMPGMLSPEDLARLDAAAGLEFDRLFLEYMIRHHKGARVIQNIETKAGLQIIFPG